MKKLHFLPWLIMTVVLICGLSPVLSCVLANQSPKPKLKVAADGLPSGHSTPEGVACDLARAFINRDERLFSEISIRPFGGGNGRAAYVKFLRETAESIKQEAARKDPSPHGPKRIGKVFAARHLTKSGPASYGYATFDFQGIMFVDVGVYLYSGERAINRTLVIQDRDGKWYVHPAPFVSPLLSDGLNEEKESVQDLTDVYELER